MKTMEDKIGRLSHLGVFMAGCKRRLDISSTGVHAHRMVPMEYERGGAPMNEVYSVVFRVQSQEVRKVCVVQSTVLVRNAFVSTWLLGEVENEHGKLDYVVLPAENEMSVPIDATRNGKLRFAPLEDNSFLIKNGEPLFSGLFSPEDLGQYIRSAMARNRRRHVRGTTTTNTRAPDFVTTQNIGPISIAAANDHAHRLLSDHPFSKRVLLSQLTECRPIIEKGLFPKEILSCARSLGARNHSTLAAALFQQEEDPGEASPTSSLASSVHSSEDDIPSEKMMSGSSSAEALSRGQHLHSSLSSSDELFRRAAAESYRKTIPPEKIQWFHMYLSARVETLLVSQSPVVDAAPDSFYQATGEDRSTIRQFTLLLEPPIRLRTNLPCLGTGTGWLIGPVPDRLCRPVSAPPCTVHVTVCFTKKFMTAI